MMRLLSIFTLLLFGLLVQAKEVSNNHLDSLKNELSKEHHDTTKAEILLILGEDYELVNIDSSKYYYLKCADYCQELAQKSDFPIINQLRAVALSDYGYLHANEGDVATALEYYHKSLAIDSLSEDWLNSATTIDNIGTVLYDIGQIDQSLAYAQKALKIREEHGDEETLGQSYINIGYVYHNYAGNVELGLEYYQKAYRLYKKNDGKIGMSKALNNIGYVYGMEQKYDLAKEHFDECISISRELNDPSLRYSALINVADLFHAQHKLDSSIFYLNEVIDLATANNSYYEISFALKNLGWIYYDLDDYSKATEVGLESMRIAKEHDFVFIQEQSNKLLYWIYDKTGKPTKAYQYYKQYIALRDSITNKKTLNNVISSQYQYQYEKQQLADSLKNVEQAKIKEMAYNQSMEKQRTYTLMGGAGFVLMLIVAVLVFRSYRQKKKANSVISAQKIEVENQRDIANTQKLIVEEKNKEILESITYAKRIQEAILPPPRLVKEWLTESFIFYKPKDIVAGDFYWMETATHKVEGKERTLVYFAAADCTGHGVPGAMMSVICANALNKAMKEFSLIEPGEVLDKVTELVQASFEKSETSIKDGMDIALCALDISAKKMFYSGANNPLYRITKLGTKVDANNKVYEGETHQLIEYKANKQPIGFYEHQEKFTTLEIQLEPGDAIYVFSDGFADQFGGEKGKKYKYSSFRKCLLDNFSNPMEEQKQMLDQEFEAWKGDMEQVDDVCVIGVKINGVEKNNFTQRELEVLVYLQEGLSSKLIADKMNISKHTVDTYRRRLLAKTGTYNATELINYCVKKEII